jgi:hypothetical protein
VACVVLGAMLDRLTLPPLPVLQGSVWLGLLQSEL